MKTYSIWINNPDAPGASSRVYFRISKSFDDLKNANYEAMIIRTILQLPCEVRLESHICRACGEILKKLENGEFQKCKNT